MYARLERAEVESSAYGGSRGSSLNGTPYSSPRTSPKASPVGARKRGAKKDTGAGGGNSSGGSGSGSPLVQRSANRERVGKDRPSTLRHVAPHADPEFRSEELEVGDAPSLLFANAAAALGMDGDNVGALGEASLNRGFEGTDTQTAPPHEGGYSDEEFDEYSGDAFEDEEDDEEHSPPQQPVSVMHQSGMDRSTGRNREMEQVLAALAAENQRSSSATKDHPTPVALHADGGDHITETAISDAPIEPKVPVGGLDFGQARRAVGNAAMAASVRRAKELLQIVELDAVGVRISSLIVIILCRLPPFFACVFGPA